MATKPEWIKQLKALQKKPRALSPAELEELILLLGGTTRPNHRPEVKVFGYNKRQLDWGAIGSVVFSFMENAEHLKKFEVELAASTDDADRAYLESRIAALRPISAKNRTAGERMAVKWFAKRDVSITHDQIKNALGTLREKAKLKRLGLAEWRALMEIEKARIEKEKSKNEEKKRF